MLEVNKNDKAIDIRKIPKGRVRFKKSIAGVLVAVVLFSGSIIKANAIEDTQPLTNKFEIESVIENTSLDDKILEELTNIKEEEIEDGLLVEIPETYHSEVKDSIAISTQVFNDIKFTKENLSTIEELTIYVYDDSTLEWMKYCENLNSLRISFYVSDYSLLSTIPKLQNLKSLEILNNIGRNLNVPFGAINLSFDNFGSIINSFPNLENFEIVRFANIEQGFLENFRHLKRLKLDQSNNKINFLNLPNLEELNFNGEPYTAAVYFTLDVYNQLVNNGVKVIFSSDEEKQEEYLEKYIDASQKLDGIVASLNINENSTSQEKLDAILIYVLDNFKYDERASFVWLDIEAKNEYLSTFYTDGYLHAVFEKDGLLCGNYASLVQALAHRVGLETYYLISNTHAWNLVNVEGEYYYVDATWLDDDKIENKSPNSPQSKILSGELLGLNWYLEDIEQYSGYETVKDDHKAINFPDFIKINSKEEQEENADYVTEENQDTQLKETTEHIGEEIQNTKSEEKIKNIGEDRYEVQVGNRKWIVSGAVVVGIMAALGGAFIVKRKKMDVKNIILLIQIIVTIVTLDIENKIYF